MRLIDYLEEYGLLLEADQSFPSITTIIAGTPIKGRWWGHPKGKLIFRELSDLAENPDIMITKLVSGKVTFVHKQLWSFVYAIGNANEAWQTLKLTEMEKRLLKIINREGSVELDRVKDKPGFDSKTVSDAVRGLEKRLLIHAEQVHTAQGNHSKIMETWENWRQRIDYTPANYSALNARASLEALVKKLNLKFNARGRLPWQ